MTDPAPSEADVDRALSQAARELRLLRREKDRDAAETLARRAGVTVQQATRWLERFPEPTDEQRAQRKMRAQLAAHESWAQTDDREHRTRAARSAFEKRFEREVDPGGVLPPEERARRAAHARKAYFLRLALKSSQARRKRRKA